MNSGTYIFKQLCQFLPEDYFEYLVNKYDGNKYIKSFTCWNHFLVMLWAQLTARESLRDIIGSLNAHRSKFYRLGFGKSVCRTTLSEANEKRNVEIFRLFAERVVKIAQDKRGNIEGLFMEGIPHRVLALDSTTVTLKWEAYSWSKVQNGKGGIKVHTMFDILTSIPVYNVITDHDVRDQSVMDYFQYEPDAFYIFDKAYVKLLSLNKIDEAGAFFVVRRKEKMNFEIIEECSCDVHEKGILRDLKIRLSNRWAKARYQKPLRIIYYYNEEKKATLEFFTNNLDLEAHKIAYLYKCRWQIEMYFKWIKQHLRIKQFYGTSENSVKIQIYVGIIAYCLVALVGVELKSKSSPFELLRILSVSLFEKENLKEFLAKAELSENFQPVSNSNLKLF
ncbi:IS4 family transposase [uncultured Acetobacteroides sp.]|uniref:IS4 family transposase n=1 Tax=uncultured Acetobacteroides sp. TaxID=1760811 RepID=UPI0029F53BB9|nr:IS4 family transposase [uncultured Acetobacteroides sp.]